MQILGRSLGILLLFACCASGVHAQSTTALETEFTHATDCTTGVTTARQGQKCIDLDTFSQWYCATPVGGTSDTLCDEADDWEQLSGGATSSTDTLQDVAGRGAVINTAVDEGTAFVVGGLVYKLKWWGNATDGVVQKIEPSQNIGWRLAEGFNASFQDHNAAPIINFEESTKTTQFYGPIVTAVGEKTVATPIAAVGTKKISAFASDGTFTLADDVQPIIVHAPPASGSCTAGNELFIDDTSVPATLSFCKVGGGNPIDVASLGNGYVIFSDGSTTISPVGGEQLTFLSDVGGILTPDVVAGTPDTFRYAFATQTANKVLASPTTGSAAAPTFRSLVEADLPATAVTTTSISALTEKTLDAEASGNTVTLPIKVWLPTANCQNTTPTMLWSSETTNIPPAACVTGTNTTKAVVDFDSTTDECIQNVLQLPDDFTGAIDVRYVWLTSASTGTAAGWCTQLVSTAVGETDDPAFPPQGAGNCVSDATVTTNQVNVADDTNITATGVAAGELLHIRTCRDANATAATDSLASDGRLIGIELTYRRAE